MDQTAPQPSGAPATGATAQNATRKPSGFLSFLGSVAAVAAPFLGPLAPVAALAGAGLNALGAQQTQNSANAAAQAATGNETALAQQIAQGPPLAPLIKQEQAGLSSAVDHANTANPGKTLLDGMGQAFTNAIAGVTQGSDQALGSAAGIYGNVGQAATSAAQAQGNPWATFGGAVSKYTGAQTPGAGAVGQSTSTLPTPAQPYVGFGQPSSGGAAGAVTDTGMTTPTPSVPSVTASSKTRGGF
jgi:hypothetical protein